MTAVSAGAQARAAKAKAEHAAHGGKGAHGGKSPHGGKGTHHTKRHRHKRKHHKAKHKHHPPVSGLPGAPAPPAIPVNPPPPSPRARPRRRPRSIARARRGGCCGARASGRRPGQAEALAGQPLEAGRRSRSRGPSGAATLQRPGTDRRRRQRARARRRLGPGPLLVAGPHDPLRPAARRADDLHLARLVRQLQREGRTTSSACSTRTTCSANTRSAASTTCSSRSRPTRRCSIFLDGIYNDKREPNENYAREMMELFSLGADRGAYTEDDVREMARALTGWTAEWTESSGPAELPLRTPRATTPATRRCSARPATGATKTRCACASPTRCTRRSSSASCGATSSRRRPPEATLASLQGLYLVAPATASARSSRRSSSTPTSSTARSW